MKILYITYGLPYPPNSGVSIHDFNIIKQTSQHNTVYVLSLLYDSEEIKWLSNFREYCNFCEVVIARKRSLWEHFSEFVQGLLSGQPAACHSFIYQEMKQKIHQLLAREKIDIVQIEHSFLAPYVEAIPKSYHCKKVLSFQNLGARQYKSMAQMQSGIKEKMLSSLKSFLMQGWEATYAQKFDCNLVVSKQERDILLNENHALRIEVIENGVDTNSLQPLPEDPRSKTLLFVGTMSYPPNADAMLYFCQKTLPLIRKKIPDVNLLIVGQNPPQEIHKLAAEGNILVTGEVSDLKPYYEQAQVVIVPLRAGGGTRLKILEAMAFGRPVVSTKLGCEGLCLKNDEHILIADDPPEFSKYVIQLLKNVETRSRLANNARQLIEAKYDWRMVGRKLASVYDALREQQTGMDSGHTRPKHAFPESDKKGETA